MKNVPSSSRPYAPDMEQRLGQDQRRNWSHLAQEDYIFLNIHDYIRQLKN